MLPDNPQPVTNSPPSGNGAGLGPPSPVLPPNPVITPTTPPQSPIQTPVQARSLPPVPPAPKAPKKRFLTKKRLGIIFIVLLFVFSTGSAYFMGKHGERIIVKAPAAPPITLPPQAIVAADCVPGLGKQYVIPKDIPDGPIYDVQNSKVIAIEYNFKAVDVFLNPNMLSNTIIPLTKNYHIDHFTTDVGQLKAGTLADAENVPVHLIIYVVSSAEANTITCPASKSS